MGKIEELFALANRQVGYQEKNSASELDDFKKNAGYNNYTKYARDINNWGLMGCQGQAWCATYQFCAIACQKVASGKLLARG